MVNAVKNKKRLIIKIESLLNKTPHYGVLLVVGIFLLMILSYILSETTGSYVYNSIDPRTFTKAQNTFEIKNFLSIEGLISFMNNGLLNFSKMNATVIVLVTIIAFGVAEKSGFLYTLFKSLLFNVPKPLVTVVLVSLALFSNISSNGVLNAGYIVLLPLGAFIYMGNDRNPLAGIAAVFAGIFGAYSINALLTHSVYSLNNMTTNVAKETLQNYAITGASDRYLMITLSIVAIAIITFLTEKYIVKILPVYDLHQYSYHKITKNEKKGLIAAIIVSILIIMSYAYWLVPKTVFDGPSSGILLGDYDPTKTTYLTQLINSAFINSFIIHISYILIVTGAVYGLVSRKFKSLSDVIKSSIVSVADHAQFFVLAFLLSQFVFLLFNSNINLFLVLKLGEFVQGNSVVTLVISLILVSAIANLFVPSSTTKWSILAPIVIPIFIKESINPMLAQSVFQAGDSFTNIVTPVLPYTIFAYALFDIYAKKTKQHCGNGTFFKLTFPYSIALGIAFIIVIVTFIMLSIPLGIGTNVFI